MHTLLDLHGNIPSFIHVSDGKLADVNALDLLVPEAGAFFVTRAKSNMRSRRLYSAPSDRRAGIVCDQTIALDGKQAKQNYPERLRRVRYKDAESGQTLVFLTNNFEIPALTVAALYRNRWQVELFSSG